MRIVAVTSRPPFPTNRGDVARLSGLITQLARTHDVACVFPEGRSAVNEWLKSRGVTPVSVRASMPDWRWARPPLQVAMSALWRSPAGIIDAADVIHISTVRSIPLVPDASLHRAHLDFVDAISQNMLERARSDRLLSPLWRAEAAALRRLEARAVDLVATTSAVSQRDAEALGSGTGVVPLAVSVPEDVPPRSVAPSLSFLGNLGYYPNVRAVLELAHDVFPRIRSQIPDCTLTLAGARPTKAILRLGSERGITVSADVDDISQYLGAAWVVAIPVRLGTGVQTKVLEAFAHARPVVTTAHVLAGIPEAEPDVHALRRENANELADAVVGLIRDPDAAERLASNAHQLVRQHFTWPRATERLLAAYEGGGHA